MLIDIDPDNVVAPFPVRRVYFLTGATGTRGYHAHRNLRQLAFCPAGSCTFVLDDGDSRREIVLGAGKGLLIEGLVWREMKDFSADCVLTVMASEVFDEADYIRDYDDFRAACDGERSRIGSSVD